MDPSFGPHILDHYAIIIDKQPYAMLECRSCGLLRGEGGDDYLRAWGKHLEAMSGLDYDDIADAELERVADELLQLRQRAAE